MKMFACSWIWERLKFEGNLMTPRLARAWWLDMPWQIVSHTPTTSGAQANAQTRTNKLYKQQSFLLPLKVFQDAFQRSTRIPVWKILRIVSNFIFDLVSVFQFESLLFKMDAQKTFQSAHIISDKSRFDLKIVLTDNLNEKKTFRWPGLFTTVAW